MVFPQMGQYIRFYNSYTTVCSPVCGDNPGAVAGGLSTNEAVL